MKDLRSDFILKTIIQEKQFEQWLKIFFYLNTSLSKDFDPIYQSVYYLKLYELLTEGLKYAELVSKYLEIGFNANKKVWYVALIDGLTEIKNNISAEEFEFIEYRRHNTSHIFQNGYEVEVDKNGHLSKGKRKGKPLDEIENDFRKIIFQHGGEDKFDSYFTEKLYPIIASLYNKLQHIFQLEKQNLS